MANRADTFDRANTTAGIGAPSDGGSSWIAGSGVWGIIGNKAYNSTAAAGSYTLLETSTPNLTYSLVWGGSPYGSASAVNGMYFRYVDASNYMLLSVSGQAMYVGRVVAGVYTAVGASYSGPNGTIISGDTIAVTVTSGNAITVTQNGVTRITTSSTANATGTKIGLYANNYAGYNWDNLVVTELVSAVSTPVILSIYQRGRQ
jgi:hypothetical protein